MKKIPIGEEDFQALINNDCYYVDKTRAIEDLMSSGSKISLFPRPRRFGKSLFISMLENFFDIDKKESNKYLFKGLYISKSSYYEELSKYPVIKLNFKEMKCDNYEDFIEKLKIYISKLFESKKYILDILSEAEKNIYFSITDMSASINIFIQSVKYLSDWLERYYREKVILLIDEYDAPISEAYVKGFYDQVMNVIKGMFSSSMKGNNSLKMGILTGILRVSRESLFSDFNNPNIYDIMTKKYNEYFGFTEPETKELLEYFGLEYTEYIKTLYDGYNFRGLSIYNPWSILKYAESKELKPYWVSTSNSLLIKKCLSELPETGKIQFEKLLKGENISFDYDERLTYRDFDNADLNKTLNLFLTSGYLTLDREEVSPITDIGIKYFRIPNEEVREELVRVVQNITFGSLRGIYSYESFIDSLFEGDKQKVENYLNETLKNISFFDREEKFYHGYILGLFGNVLTNTFIVKSNREAGKGRFDVMIEKVDRSIGAVIELKYAEEENKMEEISYKATDQITGKDYKQELELDKVKKIYTYSIVFHEKSCIVR